MRRTRGQSTAEYAIVFGVVLAALVAMQVYVKRGAQARLKVGVDQFTKAGTNALSWLPGANLSGDVTLSSTRSQYEPYYAESSYNLVRGSTTQEDVDLPSNKITRTIDSAAKEQTTRSTGGYQKQRQWAGEAD